MCAPLVVKLLTNPGTPILAPTSDSLDHLPSTLRWLLLHSSDKLVFAHEPDPRGTESVNSLTPNGAYTRQHFLQAS